MIGRPFNHMAQVKIIYALLLLFAPSDISMDNYVTYISLHHINNI